YLDTGLTNPLLMAYALDGASWNANTDFTTNLASRVVSAAVPETMQAGSEVTVQLTVLNTGNQSWTASTYDRLSSGSTNQFTWIDLNGGYSLSPSNQRVFLQTSDSISSNQKKTFTFKLIAPVTPGTYTFSAQMIR